jgi:hippurate hydrolase
MPPKNRFAEMQPEIAAWRRDLHQHPEIHSSSTAPPGS